MSQAQDLPGGATIAELNYEQCRDALVEVVRKLESGEASLEHSLALWERGEELATRCQAWLDGARERIQKAQEASTQSSE